MYKRSSLTLLCFFILCTSTEGEAQYVPITKQYIVINKLIDEKQNKEALIKLNDLLHQSIREERFAYTFVALQDMVFISEKMGNSQDQMKYLLFRHILYCGINYEFKNYPDMINLRKLIQNSSFDRFEAVRSKNEIMPKEFEFITFFPEEIDVPMFFDLFFEKNEVSLNPNDLTTLNKLSILLSSFDTSFMKVIIEGSNSSDENEGIGNKRSLNVLNYFTEKNKTLTITTMNNGSKKIHHNEDSKEGKAYNRCVDLKIEVYDIKKFIDYLGKVQINTDE